MNTHYLSLRELTIVNFRLLDFHGGGVTKQMMEDATDAVICRCTGEYMSKNKTGGGENSG